MNPAEAFLDTATMDGEKITSLYDQWVAKDVVYLADDIICLTLQDAMSGRQAVWYFDESRSYCGSHIEVVQRLQPADILTTVSPWFDTLARHALSASPEPLPDARPIPLFLATQLAAAWSVRMMGDLRQLQTALLEQNKEVARIDDAVLSSRRIRRLLGTRVGPESLVVLSPFSDAPLWSQISFVVDHQLIHRFYDTEHDCCFYLSWWEKQLDQQPGFYCPKANILISDDGMAGMLPSLILGWYLSNPDHVGAIEAAQAFEARDYGLGQASSLTIDTVEDKPALSSAPSASSADMISESWAFLHQHHPGDDPAPSHKNDHKPSSGLLGRLRSLVKKK